MLLAQFYVSSTLDNIEGDKEGEGEDERTADAGANGSKSPAGVRRGGCAQGGVCIDCCGGLCSSDT